MNKLEAGIFIRTDDGKINKFKRYITDKKRVCETDMYARLAVDNIVKASFDIIDLIEVGDYVNGYKVSRITGTRWDDNDLHCYCDYCQDQETLKWIMIAEKDIKTVVTKEQFESVSYRIGE